jgi:hypothetical protein
MKKRIFDIFLAIIFGMITTIAFFSLYGIIASFSIENKISHWIFITPKEYHVLAIYIHELFLQIFSVLPLVGILGTILGFVVVNRPKQHGVIYLVSAIMAFLFIQFIYYDFGYIGIEYTPIWSYIAQIILWAVLFITFPVIGYKMKTRGMSIK